MLTEKLRHNPWFQALGPAHFQKLVDIATEKNWSEGQIIFREGDQHDCLYLIVEGRVALEKYVPNQGQITILTLGKDELFGWSGVMPVIGTRTTGARAVQPTRAIGFDSKGLREISDADHELGYYIFRRLTNVIAGRLSATRLQLLNMYSQSTE
ncbi:MAG: Crp/Fnr family transcriptional regulator [Chloroflexi bacterium]|nr:Crp/Fnr family transcriptional regulator [Chloroflexota bacterium]